jgi:hypothetical protein
MLGQDRGDRVQLQHVKCFHRSGEPFEVQFPNKFDIAVRFSGAAYVDIDQDLAIRGLTAETRSQVRDLSGYGVLEAPLVSDGAERCIAVRDTDAEAEVVPGAAPFLGKLRDLVAHLDCHMHGSQARIWTGDRIVEHSKKPIPGEALDSPLVFVGEPSQCSPATELAQSARPSPARSPLCLSSFDDR